MPFCYQKNIKDLSTAKCGRKDLWKLIRLSSTPWMINARRAIIKAVEEKDQATMEKWLNDADYQKFVLRSLRNLKTPKGKENFKKKSNEQKLLGYADNLKSTLPVFVFSCSEFDEVKCKKKSKDGKEVIVRRRQLTGCHLNGLVMLDIDHVENPMEVWEKLKANEELMARVGFVHLTSSGHGIRIVFTADIKDGNLADNMIVFASKLGDDYTPDRSCIDATRASYAPKEDEILFIDEDRLFDYYDEQFDKKYTGDYRKKKTQPLYHQFCADNKVVDNQEAPNAPEDKGDEVADVSGIKWRGYEIQGIINQRYCNMLPCKDDSNRHTESLKLATDLILMLDGDKALVKQIVEAQPWVQEIIDERDENVEQTVESAASCIKEKEKKYAGSLPSKAMQEAIKKQTGKSFLEIIKCGNNPNPSEKEIKENTMLLQLDEWGKDIEKLAEYFPLINEVCKGKHRSAYPAALFVSSALLGTLMTRTWYHFYFDPTEERRLNYCIYIIGDPSVGKSMAGRLYKILASPIIEADRVGNDAINRYKKEVKERNTSDKEKKKEALKEPDPIIRCFGSRTANGVFIESMVRALEMVGQKPVHLHLLTFDSELDNQTNLTKGGSWIDKSVFELKCFHNEEDSQSYKNMDSVNGPFDVFWNFVYTGTPVSLRRKVTERNFGSGLATRLACIPLPPSNFKMVELNPSLTKDTSAEDIMREWAYKLDKVSGELPIWPLVEHTWHWCNEHMQLAELGNDRADEMLIKRVPYYGIASAIPFIMMRHWDEWEEHRTLTLDEYDFELSTLVMNIQYRCQHYFFGEYARNYFEDKDRDESAHNRTTRYMDCYRQLPELFTREELAKVFDVKEDYSYTIISRFVKDRAIEKDGKKTYRKLKKEL